VPTLLLGSQYDTVLPIPALFSLWLDNLIEKYFNEAESLEKGESADHLLIQGSALAPLPSGSPVAVCRTPPFGELDHDHAVHDQPMNMPRNHKNVVRNYWLMS
jgi:hypothetical protein